jgi:thioredoxin 1
LGEKIVNVSDDTFEEEVLQNKLPVLVDFWAVWCAPCQLVVPVLDYLTQSYKDKLKIVKLNVDENMKTSAKYGIASIPALLLFKGGELKETVIGALPQDKMVDIISKYL